MLRVLTIAGSDSGGGAGIQQDVKAFARLGVWGLSAVTSVTAQDATNVRRRHDLPEDVVDAQIRAAAELGIDAAKTGMLASAAIARAVADAVADCRIPNLVVDPVIASSGGDPLLDDGGVEALRSRLLPLAAAVTPNAPEASLLTGVSISDVRSQRAAARELVALGAMAAVVTGGHLDGPTIVDVVVAGDRIEEMETPRLVGDVHGTGCLHSAALAVGLAKGLDIFAAAHEAQRVVRAGIENAVELGGGRSARIP
jgi:hydroxymethylpyrimidine/phosphomethylpyrimidine kinase